ncbi:hypothetical protein FVE85_1273 [Porphyridium purpureum]|uniref:Uncharacterized protein n=1 Tax=Porphyridium purpureum TaxID=35688 RepID=A0A5J4YH37_PORPP|nr:hypothetical protein FVE85_1273 [Porphyridium purpureum]|eukprot:POR0602..scf251_18
MLDVTEARSHGGLAELGFTALVRAKHLFRVSKDNEELLPGPVTTSRRVELVSEAMQVLILPVHILCALYMTLFSMLSLLAGNLGPRDPLQAERSTNGGSVKAVQDQSRLLRQYLYSSAPSVLVGAGKAPGTPYHSEDEDELDVVSVV